MFDGIKARSVHANESCLFVTEDCPRTCGEVLQPSAKRQNNIGFCSQVVRRLTPRHANWPCIKRMRSQKRGFARDGFNNRNIVRNRKVCQFFLCQRIVNTATANDQWSLCRFQNFDCPRQFSGVGARTQDCVHYWFEKCLWKVKTFSLHILWQPNKRGATSCRVEHRRDCMGQRLQQLFWGDNAIPITNNGFERIVHCHRRISEVFTLLQNRVWYPVHKSIASQK